MTRTWLGIALLAVVLAAPACSPEDPVEEVLEQRARWKVEMLSSVFREDGSSLSTFRLSGPVNRKLDALTIRVDLLDGNGDRLDSAWHTFDLKGIERGTPTEKTVALPAHDPMPEGITFSPVLAPTEEDRRHLVELQGLEGS